ncbi:MAG: hypothetical protein JW976_04525 [Syntrophaceae bacterium]|nr:hypothetical protein [Syntrophaceae bacterium]
MKFSFSRIFWGVVCIGVGLLFLAGSWWAYVEYKKVQGYEGNAIGHITNKHFKLGADGGGNYYIDYWFMSSTGVKISASSIVAQQQWDILKVDDTLEIRFDKAYPQRNIPMYGGSPSLVFAFFMLVLGCVFLLFGTLRFIDGFKKSSRNKSS